MLGASGREGDGEGSTRRNESTGYKSPNYLTAASAFLLPLILFPKAEQTGLIMMAVVTELGNLSALGYWSTHSGFNLIVFPLKSLLTLWLFVTILSGTCISYNIIWDLHFLPR